MSPGIPMRRVHSSLILKRSYKKLFSVTALLGLIGFLNLDKDWSKPVPIDSLGIAPSARTLALLALGLILLVRFGIAVVFAYLHWRRFTYTITPDDVTIESGRILCRRRVVPFAQIQNIEVERSLFDRLFGTALVKVEVAGGTADEGTLEALPVAEVVRLHIAARRPIPDIVRNAESDADPPLLTMSNRRLFVAGLFGWWVAGAALLMPGFDPITDWIEDWATGEELPSSGLAGWITHFTTELSSAGIAGVVCLFAIAVLLASSLASIILNYRFRILHQGDSLRLTRGLVLTKERLIPLNRVQGLRLSNIQLNRPIGWYKLDVRLQDSTKSDNSVVLAPLAKLAELQPLLSVLGYSLPEENHFRGVERRFPPMRTAKVAWKSLQSCIVPLAGIWFFFPGWLPWAGAAAALLWSIAVLHEALRWRSHKHQLANATLYVRYGALFRRTQVVRANMIKANVVSQSVIERQLGLASVTFDIAGASVFDHVTVHGLSLRDALVLVEQVKQAARPAPPPSATYEAPTRLARAAA